MRTWPLPAPKIDDRRDPPHDKSPDALAPWSAWRRPVRLAAGCLDEWPILNSMSTDEAIGLFILGLGGLLVFGLMTWSAWWMLRDFLDKARRNPTGLGDQEGDDRSNHSSREA
jgi:hypothetical protein